MTHVTYTLYPKKNGQVIRSDGKVVAPCQSHDDPDFLAYKDWVHAGNEPELDHSEDPVVPDSITARQIRLALNKLDKRKLVEDSVKMSEQDVQDDWEYGTEFSMSNQIVQHMRYVLKIDVDALFLLGASL